MSETKANCASREVLQVENLSHEVICQLDAGHSGQHTNGMFAWERTNAELYARAEQRPPHTERLVELICSNCEWATEDYFPDRKCAQCGESMTIVEA